MNVASDLVRSVRAPAESGARWKLVPAPGGNRAGKEVMNKLQDIIAQHAFFRGMKPAHLATLTACAREAEYKPGDVLFREGEPANRFFLIQSGRIAVEGPKIGPGLPTPSHLRRARH